MLSLMYLAMNPNLSEAEFMALTKQALDAKTKLLEDTCAAILKMPPEYRLEATVKLLPMLLAI